ncbi:MAG: hypothetical protein C0623_00275 [Desulfuromonas sp.]|nr:MAG: hypothetical protein C0623_00275 [Desulfuromonas sp.]
MTKETPICEFIDECTFYDRFGDRQSNVWKAIINMYCRGHSRHLCEFYLKKKETGVFFVPNIMPNGSPVSLVYQHLP